MTDEPRPEEAELDEEATQRMEELVDDQAERETAALVDSLDLENAGEEEDKGLDERVRSGTVTEMDLISKARTALYEKLGTLTVRELATIYVTGLRLEEARLKVRIKERGEKDSGIKDAREKVRRAMRGQHADGE